LARKKKEGRLGWMGRHFWDVLAIVVLWEVFKLVIYLILNVVK